MVLERKSLSHKRWYFGMLYQTASYNVICNVYIYRYIHMSQCQKVVHGSGSFVVKIKHQNCLLQVNHVTVLCLKIIFSLAKTGFMPYLRSTT